MLAVAAVVLLAIGLVTLAATDDPDTAAVALAPTGPSGATVQPTPAPVPVAVGSAPAVVPQDAEAPTQAPPAPAVTPAPSGPAADALGPVLAAVDLGALVAALDGADPAVVGARAVDLRDALTGLRDDAGRGQMRRLTRDIERWIAEGELAVPVGNHALDLLAQAAEERDVEGDEGDD